MADVSDVIQPIRASFNPGILDGVNYLNNQTGQRSFYAIPTGMGTYNIHYWKPYLDRLGLDAGDISRDWQRFWQFWQPVMDGYEATQTIKATTRGQATAIIALTASVLEEEKAVMLSAGCEDFMRKPFREEYLFAAMHEHIGVEFIYEETQAKTTQPIKEILTRENLKILPEAWQTDLKEAVINSDRKAMNGIVEKIALKNEELAEALQKCLYNFEYEKILKLLS